MSNNQRVIRQENASETPKSAIESVDLSSEQLNALYEIVSFKDLDLTEYDFDLVEKIKKAVEIQQELNEVRKRMAQIKFEPYFVDQVYVSVNETKFYNLIIKTGEYEEQKISIKCYDNGSYEYSYVSLATFKEIASLIGSKSAIYIDSSLTKYMHLTPYLAHNSAQFSKANYDITILLKD